MTQGLLVSLTVFNILMDAVIKMVLLEVCGPQEAHYGLVWEAADHNILFYADVRSITGHNSIWVQTTLITVVRMFERVGLQMNLGKTKSIVFIPSFIWWQ